MDDDHMFLKSASIITIAMVIAVLVAIGFFEMRIWEIIYEFSK